MPYVFNPEMDAVMAGMPFGFYRSDMHAHVVYSNGYLERTHGVPNDHIKGSSWQRLLHPEDRKELLLLFAKEFFRDSVTFTTVRLMLPGGKIVPVLFLIDSLHDQSGNRMGFLVNLIDVSLALHDFCGNISTPQLDPLTQVLTRLDFLKALSEVSSSKKTPSMPSALVLFDIKGLEKFNELWGYSLGDQLLILLAETLRNLLGTQYKIGRIESAKFAVFIDSIENHDKLYDLMNHLYAKCNQSLVLPQGTFILEVSIGVSVTTSEIIEFDPILRHALEALSLAKKKMPRIEYLDEKDHRVYRRSARIVSYLFDAIAQDQFELYYQSQINIQTNKIIGIETLLRWKHPELGFIEPDEFIPIAEESGFIIHVGKWVMDHALKQYKHWRYDLGSCLDEIKLSINLSPLQLLDQNLIPELMDLLKKYEVKPSALIIELTENAVMSDPQNNIEVMNQLHELGVRFSLDDFGTGYSSLNYIRYLPIHQLKIDRSFIKASEHSRQDTAIIKATISLAEALGVEVVAEGVEVESEIKFLHDNGCKIVQGFYYSHPLNAKGMEEYIVANT